MFVNNLWVKEEIKGKEASFIFGLISLRLGVSTLFL